MVSVTVTSAPLSMTHACGESSARPPRTTAPFLPRTTAFPANQRRTSRDDGSRVGTTSLAAGAAAERCRRVAIGRRGVGEVPFGAAFKYLQQTDRI